MCPAPSTDDGHTHIHTLSNVHTPYSSHDPFFELCLGSRPALQYSLITRGSCQYNVFKWVTAMGELWIVREAPFVPNLPPSTNMRQLFHNIYIKDANLSPLKFECVLKYEPLKCVCSHRCSHAHAENIDMLCSCWATCDNQSPSFASCACMCVCLPMNYWLQAGQFDYYDESFCKQM